MISEQIAFALEALAGRVATEVPPTGDFRPVTEFFENEHRPTQQYVGKFALTVYKMPANVVSDDAQRYLDAEAYTPDGGSKISMAVCAGKKEEILAKLKSPELVKRLVNCFAMLVDNIKD